MKVKYHLNGSNGDRVTLDLHLLQRITRAGATVQSLVPKHVIFSQGDSASRIFYIGNGRVKLTVLSSEGKSATIAILNKDDFLGEECLLLNHPLRLSSAVAITDCSLLQIEKVQMLSALDRDRDLARHFTDYLLKRKIRAEEDLTDWFFHSSEKRLARVLLLLAGIEGSRIPGISQEFLAEMVGTTRPRISYFMTKFRKLGLVDYRHGLRVCKELQKVL